LNQIDARLFNDPSDCNEDMPMDQNRVAGTANELGGQLEEGFGRATGDIESQLEGRMKQVAGAAQNLYGQARDAAGAMQRRAAPFEEALRNTIENRPYTAVAIALAIGWLVGRMGRD
jgi:uncharacterized protein YjbJ (UPF0337 family)